MADPGQDSASQGWMWARCFVSASALPPWQSVQPIRTSGLRCMSPTPAWQATQPWLFRSASTRVCFVRSIPSRCSGSGKGLAGSAPATGGVRFGAGLGGSAAGVSAPGGAVTSVRGGWSAKALVRPGLSARTVDPRAAARHTRSNATAIPDQFEKKRSMPRAPSAGTLPTAAAHLPWWRPHDAIRRGQQSTRDEPLLQGDTLA